MVAVRGPRHRREQGLFVLTARWLGASSVCAPGHRRPASSGNRRATCFSLHERSGTRAHVEQPAGRAPSAGPPLGLSLTSGGRCQVRSWRSYIADGFTVSRPPPSLLLPALPTSAPSSRPVVLVLSPGPRHTAARLSGRPHCPPQPALCGLPSTSTCHSRNRVPSGL